MLGYTFNDNGLIEQALTHRSMGGVNNERLEFLGDAILGFVIADELFKRFQSATEGQLSRLRSSLVKRETLAVIARDLSLSDYLNLGQGELSSGGQFRDSILADAQEAILAAIYLDGGFDKSQHVILTLYHDRLQGLDLKAHQKDPKTRLQEYLQARKLGLPSYEVIETSGTPHAQIFKVRCHIEDIQEDQMGSGSSRRRAEQDAARHMLQELQNG